MAESGKIMELKLTGKMNGSGDVLYVVTKNDSDNYQGLWWANDEKHLLEQLILTRCDTDDHEDYAYTKEDIECNFAFHRIGMLIEFKP